MASHIRIPLLVSLLSIAVFLVAGAGDKKEDEANIRVAIFDVDVTPPKGSAMAYTTVEKNPELSLRCRGVVLLGSGRPIVLAAIDWIGVANEGYDQFRDALAEAAGTTRERVALHALHQHDAPGCDFTAEKLVREHKLKGYERTKGDFHRQVIQRTARAISEAIPTARAATHWGWGEAEVEKVASNRRLLGPDGKVRAVRYTATRDPALRAEPEGTIDPEVSLLSFWNGNKPVAVLSYYACHPQSYYRTGTPSPDFPGIARFMRGQGVPEALHVHFNGAGGDLGAGKYNDGHPENRMILASRLAEGMRKAWVATRKWPLEPEAVDLRIEKVRLPLAAHLEDENAVMEALKKEPGRGYFAKVDQAAFMLRHKAGARIDLSCLTVGDARVLHMPGELFIDYQLAAKKMRPDLKVAMAAYGEYGTGYIGTEIAYSQGGYETSQGASAVGLGSEKILTAAMKRLLQVKNDQRGGRVGPLEPEAAMAMFEVPPGFELQLVASEPQIHEPIVVAYDENGQMYVAEYLKFPSHRGESDGPDGCIRLLRDEDGDGKYETSRIFADGLAWPTGICCWDGGVYVVSAPDLWYLKDTTGDGVADKREKVFTGFGFRNDEGTANNLFWGLDHWIYGAGSNSGGEITRVGDPEGTSVSIRGRDFRFHPRTREFQALSGGEQFGNAMDDWGNRFLSQNSKPAVHVVLPSQSLERNPHLPAGRVKIDIWKGNTIYRASEIEPWRLARTKLRRSEKRKYGASMVAHDVFSGCSGLQIYRGAVYPEEFHGNLYVGDVQGNLIHRRRLSPDGVTFSSERTEIESEFVRSTDNWFRPANLVNAPDGTLHIVDMYRETIETPDSMVPEILKMVDFRNGRDRGRVYRLAPEGFKPSAQPKLGGAKVNELIAALENPNGWWRDTAGRLLVQKRDSSALGGLRRILHHSHSVKARIHALYVIEELGGLEGKDLEVALTASSLRLREHGLRLYRKDFQNCRKWVLAAAAHDDARVRFQAALTLGNLEGDDVVFALAKLALRDGQDFWMRSAILSARPELAWPLFERLLHEESSLLEPLARVVGARNERTEVESLLGKVKSSLTTSPVNTLMTKLGEGLQQAGTSLKAYPESNEVLSGLIEHARQFLGQRKGTVKEQVAAVALLGQGQWETVGADLHGLLDATRAPRVQLAALVAISAFGETDSAGELIKRLPSLSPTTQTEVIESLLTRKNWIVPLLEAVKNKRVPPGLISQAQQIRLRKHPETEVRRQAALVLASEENPRNQVIQKYRAALTLQGSASKGRKIFEANCLACHKQDGQGHELGPNLATVKNRDPDAILIQILDPNREVLSGYLQYFVALEGGRTVTGRIVNESSAGLTLRRAGGVEEAIPRHQIKSITSSGLSLMPDGFETAIDLQEMSDLLAFLKS